MTGDNWAIIVRTLYDPTGQPSAVNVFFVSYVVRIPAPRARKTTLRD